MRKTISAESTFVLDHQPRCRCGNQAVGFLEVHRVNDCAREATLGSFKCAVCMKRELNRIDGICADGGGECDKCGLVVVNPEDMIVRVVRLR